MYSGSLSHLLLKIVLGTRTQFSARLLLIVSYEIHMRNSFYDFSFNFSAVDTLVSRFSLSRLCSSPQPTATHLGRRAAIRATTYPPTLAFAITVPPVRSRHLVVPKESQFRRV